MFVSSCQMLPELKSEAPVVVLVAYPQTVRTAFYRVYAGRHGITAYVEILQWIPYTRAQP